MTKKVKESYKILTEPLYKATKDESDEQILKHIELMCTELRLGQRSISIVGVNHSITKTTLSSLVRQMNNRLREDGDRLTIKYEWEKLTEYNVIILYREKLYLKIFEEVSEKRATLSPHLYHYVYTKLFGYSNNALHIFLKKWVDK